jgi:hypothetical protein
MHTGKLSREDARLYHQLYFNAFGTDLGSTETREEICSTLLGLRGCRSEDLASEIFILKIIGRMTYEKLSPIIAATLKAIKKNNTWKTVIFYNGAIGYKGDLLSNKIRDFQRNTIGVATHADSYMDKILRDARV